MVHYTTLYHLIYIFEGWVMRIGRRKVKINITLDKRLVRGIDEVRGSIPRSCFIQFLIEAGLKVYGSGRRLDKSKK